DAFVATGTVHILVIAGLHVAILAAILSAIARALPLDGRGRAAIVALGLLVYVALAGPRPGAVRATVGAIVFVVAGASGRGGDAWNRLAVSLCAMLALDPRCVEEAGFVLSFGTVAGLLALARAFERALEGGARDRRFAVEASRSQRARAWLSRRLRRESAASLAAFVAHAPLVLVAFGQVAPAVVLANLPAIPLATLALGAGIGGAALGAVHPLLGRPLLLVAGLAARALVATVELLSRVPLATLDLARPSAAATALALGGAALALSLASGGAPRRRTRALLGVSAVFWLAAVLPRTLEAPRLEVVPERPGAPLPETAAPAPRLVLLPGRGGLAALLLLEDGRAIRIGSGGGRSVERSLARIAKDSGGPRSPDISLAFFQGEDGTEGPCELSGLPAGVSISLLGDDGARIVRVEANGRAALVLDDPGGRALARVLESVEEPRLHAQVLIAPARASVALRALVERTRPLVVVSRDARRGGPVSRALEEAGSSPLELASTGALEIELGEELSVRALR
ncbi:ComEC/Rec2 family competence protein, partial [bacterium]|nr:ComEC/Rec2 family competence protein [bacterium]